MPSKVVASSLMRGIAERLCPKTMEAWKVEIGNKVEDALHEKIEKGDASWATLSPAWQKIKGHGRQWTHTGRMERAFEYRTNDAGVRIGILDLSFIGMVAGALEYGTSTIPPRPLFRAVFDENVDEIIELAREEVWERVIGETE